MSPHLVGGVCGKSLGNYDDDDDVDDVDDDDNDDAIRLSIFPHPALGEKNILLFFQWFLFPIRLKQNKVDVFHFYLFVPIRRTKTNRGRSISCNLFKSG